MKKMKILSLALCLLLVLSLLTPSALAAETEAAEETAETAAETEAPNDPNQYRNNPLSGAPEYEADCGAALLIELQSGTVVYAKNEEDIMFPASLTKIMTCMLALQYGKLDDVLTVSETAVAGIAEAGGEVKLEVGEQLTLRNVLYYMMVVSSNEAANVVAEYISADIPTFVTLMNTTAKELGCTNTHFVTPHGLHDSNHYTTAKDLSIITRHALNNETFREITSTAAYDVPATNKQDPRHLVSTNYLISTETLGDYYYPNAIGIKTGYTSAAGRCVISRASDGNLNLLCIILNASTDLREDGSVRYNNFVEARKLFDYGFENFSYAQVVTKLQPTDQVPVQYAKDHKGVVLIPSENINCLLPKEYDKSKITTEYTLSNPQGLTAPIEQGEKVGTLQAFYNGQLIGETTVETLTSVEASVPESLQESVDFMAEYGWIILLLIGLVVLLLLLLWIDRKSVV